MLKSNKILDKDTQENQCKQWIMGFIANTLIFTYGMQSGWMSPSIIVLQGSNSPSGYPLTDYEISLIASTICITGVFFCTGFSVIIDKYGRKIGLIIVGVTQALAWIFKLISADLTWIIVSQVFAGIAGSGVFTVTPLYTKEIASDSIRGAMGGFGILLQSVGLFVMYAMGAYMNYFTILWIVMWIPIVNVLLILMAPESPPYLVKRGKEEEAKKTLSFLMGLEQNHKIVLAAMEELTSAQKQFDKLPKISIKQVFSDKASRRGFYLGFFMITLLDSGGNFAIFSYASVIVKNSGVTEQPGLQSLSFPAIMILGSLLSSFTVEKFGRKPLLISSLLMNGLPMTVLGSILLMMTYGLAIPSWIPVACVTISVFAFGAGVLPIPYIVMTETLNFQIRARFLGVYVTFGWFCCFLQNITFTPISEALGMHSVFFIFGGINFCSAMLCIIWMPETKGKSLEQIQKELCAK